MNQEFKDFFNNIESVRLLFKGTTRYIQHLFFKSINSYLIFLLLHFLRKYRYKNILVTEGKRKATSLLAFRLRAIFFVQGKTGSLDSNMTCTMKLLRKMQDSFLLDVALSRVILNCAASILLLPLMKTYLSLFL